MVCGKSLRFLIHKFETSQEEQETQILVSRSGSVGVGARRVQIQQHSHSVISGKSLRRAFSCMTSTSIEYASKTRKDEELIML